MITRDLYGLKTSIASFRSYLADTLYALGYTPIKSDPDTWLRKAVKADRFQYYEMVLCYVDDVLCILDDPMRTMKGIQSTFKLQDYKINEQEDYLGSTLENMILSDGSQCWSMSSAKYIKVAVQNVEETLAKYKKRFPERCVAPLQLGYRPETDDSAESKADGLQYYQELIGVLRWIVELR